MGLLNRLVDSMKQPTDRWDFNRNRESKRGFWSSELLVSARDVAETMALAEWCAVCPSLFRRLK
jgi:hypothetical protein